MSSGGIEADLVIVAVEVRMTCGACVDAFKVEE
jgi:hypothetical protein